MNSLTYPDTQLQEFDRVRDMSTDKANRAIDASTRESIERATAGGRAATNSASSHSCRSGTSTAS
jgi:hypothetical protein